MANNKKKNFIKDAAVLCVITLVAGALLGVVNELTKGPIEQAKLNAKTSAYKAVYDGVDFAESEEFNAYIASDAYTSALANAGVDKAAVTEGFTAVDDSGAVVGYVMSSTTKGGYGGDITISIGVTKEGQVTGIEFLLINESPGLGMNAKDKPEWRTQYYGKDVAMFSVGSDIDALSGATITSKAVTNAVNAALVLVSEFGG